MAVLEVYIDGTNAAERVRRTMERVELRRVIHEVASLSLLTSLTSLGCGHTSECGEIADATPPSCRNAQWQMLDDTNPAVPSDYAAVMEQISLSVVSVIGEPCSGASDPATCEAALEQAIGQGGGRPGTGQIPQEFFMVTTSGNEARRWSTRAEWLEFLGPIDTPQEAMIIAWYDGYSIGCDSIGAAPEGDGFITVGTKMTSDCAPVETTQYELDVSRSGDVDIACSVVLQSDPGCVGRRPSGLLRAKGDSGSSRAGRFFARIAYLESAAVLAFQNLAEELADHDAPHDLVEDARRAALDEVRHAAVMGLVAERFGGQFRPARAEKPSSRSLEDMAVENAVEGCIRETFGAVVAAYQARACEDETIARALAAIAEDEARHAELSWRVAAWLDLRLSDGARRRVAKAAHRAFDDLKKEMDVEPHACLVASAGLPKARIAQRMLAMLEKRLPMRSLLDQRPATYWVDA